METSVDVQRGAAAGFADCRTSTAAANAAHCAVELFAVLSIVDRLVMPIAYSPHSMSIVRQGLIDYPDAQIIRSRLPMADRRRPRLYRACRPMVRADCNLAPINRRRVVTWMPLLLPGGRSGREDEGSGKNDDGLGEHA
jgi:hypothetical protein